MSSSKGSGSKSPPRGTVDAVRACLRGVAEAMRYWTDADMIAFLAGDLEITIRSGARPSRRGQTSSEEIEALVEAVRNALGPMNTREEGIEHLKGMNLSRDDLRRLVGALDLPLNHS